MIKACIFDAFGTLFKMALPHNIAHDPQAQEILSICRQKQLEYTWLYSLMGKYESFDTITQMALDFGFKNAAVDNQELQEILQAAFFTPVYFEDVPDTLEMIKNKGLQRAILSNGSPKMLSEVVSHTQLQLHFEAVLSVDTVQMFKPSPKVYQMALNQLALTKNEVLFLSSNQWDVAGAHSFGLQTAWINRSGKTQEPIILKPGIEVLSNLTQVRHLI
ncbi:haloacid dehalogenase type II [Spongiimicrobium salis]|uniref:haloacid dehalogenase type II n=1 Tax=Spongiimicrobium salis TaxID=1667022 RepID=UPI00374DD6D8